MNITIDEIKRNKMENANRILIVSPHPDDAEIIAGGYILKSLKRGANVKLIIVTDGSKGTKIKGLNMKETRKKEQMESAAILGIKEIKFLDIEDTFVPHPRELIEILMPEIREYSPDLLITVDPFLKYEVHPDHINTGMGVLQCVLFYEFPNIGHGDVRGNVPDVALSPTNNPNVIIDITDVNDTKSESLKAHRSQALDINLISNISEMYGKMIKSKWGEPFKYLYPWELHINIDLEKFF
ncbi:MAG: PIG-L deacetylase family protein [Thermoplasmata archaeon]